MEKTLMRKEVYQAFKECLSKDKTREALQALHVTTKHVEATDGRILLRSHRDQISLEGDKAGVFKILSTNKASAGFVEVILEKIDLQYPDTDRVIPESNGSRINVTIMPEKDDPVSLTATALKVYKHTGNAYSINLFKKIACLKESWSIEATNDKPLKAIAGSHTAVIMPFKL